jgi:hypothetical protein
LHGRADVTTRYINEILLKVGLNAINQPKLTILFDQNNSELLASMTICAFRSMSIFFFQKVNSRYADGCLGYLPLMSPNSAGCLIKPVEDFRKLSILLL